MVNARDKGARAEMVVRDVLRQYSGLNWERTPASGALDAKHLMKGDLYCPGKNIRYCVEVKHYAEDQLTSSVLTAKSPVFMSWWEQAEQQAQSVNKEPLLIFKYDRSKLFCAQSYIVPGDGYRSIWLNQKIFISLLEDWLEHERPEFEC